MLASFCDLAGYFRHPGTGEPGRAPADPPDRLPDAIPLPLPAARGGPSSKIAKNHQNLYILLACDWQLRSKGRDPGPSP